MPHETRQAIEDAEENLKQLSKELELDRYLRNDNDPFPSRRVFKLLKNTDLESVTFGNVESAGNPIYIEDLNRQELFDLVLVNFARLCVDGEWDGLLTAGASFVQAEYVTLATEAGLTEERVLTAGSGISLVDGGAGSTLTISSGGGNPGVNPAKMTGLTAGIQNTNVTPPYVGGQAINAGYWDSAPRFYPFFALNTGDLATVSINVASSSTDQALLVGIYSDDDGVPDELLGYVTLDTSSDGVSESSSFSETITTGRGTMYWMGYTKTGSQDLTCTGSQELNQYLGINDQIDNNNVRSQLDLDNSAYALPSTVTAGDLGFVNVGRFRIGIEW